MLRIAILSDTHGLLRPEVLPHLEGADYILHAGDVGDPGILQELQRIAPVQAVRGNVDPASFGLPETLEDELGGLPLRMVHRREDVPPDWLREAKLIVFGHSHRPELEWRGSCLLLNPGAVGPRRFRLPLTMAIVTVRDSRLVPEILSVE